MPANADPHRKFCVTQIPKISFSKENKDEMRSCTTGKQQGKFNSFPRKNDENRVSATFSSPLRINSFHASNDFDNNLKKQEPKAYKAYFPPPPQNNIEETKSLTKNEISKVSTQNTSYSPKPVILGNSKKLNISLKSEFSPAKKKSIEKGDFIVLDIFDDQIVRHSVALIRTDKRS
jgi:hypothetical protein